MIAGANAALGQSSSFTFQGRLTDGGTPANGNYDLQFALWDSLSGGAQVGSTQTLNTVAVSNGVFTVSLDFGANAFPGASRFLEIGARPSGSGSFTPLTPRQPITSTPYAVRSLNASTADSVPASGVPAGSGNYIQNSASAQASSNFNISGNGTAGGTLSGNVVNATTQFNLNRSRILSSPGSQNLFAGKGAGTANTTGSFNAFFGDNAGLANVSGVGNAFFGSSAGESSTGSDNAFFGAGSGSGALLSGIENAFFGAGAGNGTRTGSSNSFFGYLAGSSNVVGDSNTLIGSNANVGGNLSSATAIGANTRVDASNSLVLGSIGGVTGGPDTNVGIGTTKPAARLHVNDGGGHILFTRAGCIAPFAGIMFASSVTGSCTNYALLGGDGNTYLNRPTGGSLTLREGNVEQFTIQSGGNAIFVKTVQLNTLGTAGGSALCRNSAFQIAFCSSSLRYKTDVEPFAGGLQLIKRLQPVRFAWKTNLQPDIGLIAEDVAQVEPLLTFKNQNGEIEGVNYSQLSVVLINAVKEQQAQIKTQQQQIDALKKLVCPANPQADVCKAKE